MGCDSSRLVLRLWPDAIGIEIDRRLVAAWLRLHRFDVALPSLAVSSADRAREIEAAFDA